jgi:hypothetical protein
VILDNGLQFQLGEVESLFVDMLVGFGLGGAVGNVPVGPRTESARDRKG